jgi:Golgi nucleoside diphosphatase
MANPKLKCSGLQAEPEDEKRRHPHEWLIFKSSGFPVSTSLLAPVLTQGTAAKNVITFKSPHHLHSELDALKNYDLKN